MKFLLLVFVIYILNQNVNCWDSYTFDERGECRFVKYEAGDGTVNISPIPKIEAAVPTTILADMFGKATSKVIARAGLTANGFMHFGNAAKGIFKMFANTAPKLGPCLGILGVAFGFINKELNSVKPKDIIDNVNKAIDQVIDATNRRFEVMEELVYQETRNYMREFMNDDYRGIFEKWVKCVRKATKDDVTSCQENTVDSMTEKKFHFMMQTKFQEDPDGPLKEKDIKALELQLPMTKKWADLHLLVLAALVKFFEDEKNNNEITQEEKNIAKSKYVFYKGDLMQDGDYYIQYMKWALERIKRGRIQDQNVYPNLDCKGWDDVIKRWWWFPTDNNLKSSTRKCSFKCTTMKTTYCDLTVKFRCGYHCKLCAGLFCDTTSPMASKHRLIGSSQSDKANSLCKDYRNNLKADVDAFWEKEIELFLPIMEDVIKELDDDNNYEEGSGRDAVPEGTIDSGKDVKLSAEDMKLNEQLNRLSEKKKKAEKAALEGVTAQMSFAEYLATVKKNTDQIDKKKAKKMKKKNKKKNIQVSK